MRFINKINFKGPRKYIIIILFLFFSNVFTVVYFINTNTGMKNSSDSVKAVLDEPQAILQEVGKILELPQDEIPTIATIKDKKNLEGQDFFMRAEDGDKVFFFTKSSIGVIYRPATKKIINYTTSLKLKDESSETEDASQQVSGQ